MSIADDNNSPMIDCMSRELLVTSEAKASSATPFPAAACVVEMQSGRNYHKLKLSSEIFIVRITITIY